MSDRITFCLVAFFVLAAAWPADAQIFTGVERLNPDGNSGDTPVVAATEPLAEGSVIYVDRAHAFMTVPDILLGADYIMTANDDKDNPNHELVFTVTSEGTLYLIIDNRVGTDVGNQEMQDPDLSAVMTWVTDMGFEDTGLNVGIDEAADGDIDQWSSIFALAVKPGDYTLLEQNDGGGRNMYSVAFGVPYVKASKPNPADGDQAVITPLFQWVKGDTAIFHNVYLGTSPELTEADRVGSNLPIALYYHGPGLVAGTTYYWRVDEIERDMQTVHTGDVWSFFAAPLTAFAPQPRSGARWVDPEADLSWTAGNGALTHEVYFGTDETAVAEGSGDTLKASQFLTTFELDTLDPETTYYWRVDEVMADGTTRQTGPVWSFTTLPAIPVGNPDLLAWWKMDAGEGTTAVDWSGYGHHATFREPEPIWVTGLLGGALEFAGNGDSAVYSRGDYLNDLDALTITAWIKSDLTDTDKGFLIFEPPSGADNHGIRYDAAGATGGGTNVIKAGITIAEDAATNTIIQIESSDNVQTTDWQHVALVWSSGAPLQLYINGVLDTPTAVSAAVSGVTTGFSTTIIGRSGKDQSGSWDGLIDEVRVFGTALTENEIKLAMRGDPTLAWNPSPANGAVTDATKALPLMWSPGDLATQHDVYLASERMAVDEAGTADTETYRGRMNVASFTPSEPLAWGREYFWRVDEVNSDGTVTKGLIWKFTLTDYLIVDDFESYDDDMDAGTAIFQVWIDGIDNGTGAFVGYELSANGTFGETSIVIEGAQSMPLAYDNSASPWYSQTYREFSPVQDWTIQGLTDLTLWVQGGVASFVEVGPGQISMSGGGADIWNNADECRFAYKTLTGDGSLTARVTAVGPGSNTWAKGGAMIRQSLEPGSANVFIAVTGGQGDGGTFQWRPAADDISSSSRTLTGIAPPYWVRLVREGNTFTGYMSADGENWVQEGQSSVDVGMTDPVFIGLAVTAHQAGEIRGYAFDNVAATGNVTGAWRPEDIGVVQGDEGNDVADLYLVVEDSAGKSAKVRHPNPGMTVTPAWDQWIVPLDSLTGVNLARVKRLAISVGDPDNPTPDGTGILYVDDIRVTKPAPMEGPPIE